MVLMVHLVIIAIIVIMIILIVINAIQGFLKINSCGEAKKFVHSVAKKIEQTLNKI
jgi:hypothetical protein